MSMLHAIANALQDLCDRLEIGSASAEHVGRTDLFTQACVHGDTARLLAMIEYHRGLAALSKTFKDISRSVEALLKHDSFRMDVTLVSLLVEIEIVLDSYSAPDTGVAKIKEYGNACVEMRSRYMLLAAALPPPQSATKPAASPASAAPAATQPQQIQATGESPTADAVVQQAAAADAAAEATSDEDFNTAVDQASRS